MLLLNGHLNGLEPLGQEIFFPAIKTFMIGPETSQTDWRGPVDFVGEKSWVAGMPRRTNHAGSIAAHAPPRAKFVTMPAKGTVAPLTNLTANPSGRHLIDTFRF